MILDSLSHAQLYLSLGERIAAALAYLQSTDLTALSSGKQSVRGERIYAMVNDYVTRPRKNGIWEAHRKYIDVQYMVSGSEKCGWADISNLRETDPYQAQRDAGFYQGEGDVFTLSAGQFAIFFPHDGHMPGLIEGSAQKVRKVVMKVAV